MTVSHGPVAETVIPRTIPGWVTVVPPLLTIALAIIFRQVLVALFAGIWAGAIIIYSFNLLAALLRTFDTHVLGSLADPANASIILFTLALGGMIGVVGRSGGTRALVDAISRRAKSRRSGMIVTWLMGLVIFFDDYANCLLVGNTMRPLTDRVRISREKLSFLVDGTAAPVASVAIISIWIGVELTMLVSSGVVATPDEAFAVFIATIPYRFYSVLMLLFVFAIAFTQRDLGPMLRAEQRAIATGQVLREGAQPLVDREITEMKVPEGKRLLWYNAVVPLAGMMLIVVLGLYLSGRSALGGKAQGAGLREIFGAADSLPVLIWASFGGGLLAVGMSLCTRAIRLSEAIDAWVVGCKSMVIAVIILVLAWTIGDMCRTHLQTGPWIISLVRPPANLMPLIFFILSCLIAFSTGTSFGTKDARSRRGRLLPRAARQYGPGESPSERLVAEGTKALSTEELLALLVARDGRDTEGEAVVACENLLKSEGGLRNLANRCPAELARTKGLPKRRTPVIAAAMELARRWAAEERPTGRAFNHGEDFFKHYYLRLRDLKKEVFISVLLDQKHRFLSDEVCSEGSLTASLVHPREVFRRAVRESAAAVAFVHNHPSGEPFSHLHPPTVVRVSASPAEATPAGLVLSPHHRASYEYAPPKSSTSATMRSWPTSTVPGTLV